MITVRNAMTVDVEDYFQVQAFTDCIDRSAWDGLPQRVERNTHFILDQFANASISATFFTLGWVAQRHPTVVRRIVAEGHELASHGWDHVRADQQDPVTFRADVERSKGLLEHIAGERVKGYRAATFSINAGNQWAYPVLRDAGYAYSSSVNPIRHDLYGMPEAPRTPFHPCDDGIPEIPMTTARFWRRNWPCSGGGYFRLLPAAVHRTLLRHVNMRERRPGIFYFHPWEIDPDQPRISRAGWKSQLRHYTNLSAMPARIDRLLRDFTWDRMDRVYAPVLNSASSS